MFSLSLSRRYKQPRESAEPLFTSYVPYEPAGRRTLSLSRCEAASGDLPKCSRSDEAHKVRTMSADGSSADLEHISDQNWLEQSATVLATQKGAAPSCFLS